MQGEDGPRFEVDSPSLESCSRLGFIWTIFIFEAGELYREIISSLFSILKPLEGK